MIETHFLPNETDSWGQRGVFAPLFVCDACQRTIENHGNAIFDMAGPPKGQPSRVRFAHKGYCTDVIDDRISTAGGFPGWAEIHTWIDWLQVSLHPLRG